MSAGAVVMLKCLYPWHNRALSCKPQGSSAANTRPTVGQMHRKVQQMMQQRKSALPTYFYTFHLFICLLCPLCSASNAAVSVSAPSVAAVCFKPNLFCAKKRMARTIVNAFLHSQCPHKSSLAPVLLYESLSACLQTLPGFCCCCCCCANVLFHRI